RDRRRQDDARHLRVTDAELELPRRFLGDLDVEIHLVGRARHLDRVDVDVLEEAEALQAHLERSIAACEYQAPSYWRISRRRTWSCVLVLPLKLIRRTYTRGPGSTKKVRSTVWFCSSTLGIGETLANA